MGAADHVETIASSVAEARAVNGQPLERHLEPDEVAAYLDRAIVGDARARLESHLAECDACRDELMAASRILGALRRRSAMPVAWMWAAAVAAVIFIVAWPSTRRDSTVEMREAPVTTTVAPRALSPVGAVTAAPTLTWSSVPFADRYRVRVFDADGAVALERETNDTTLIVPSSVNFGSGRAWFWRVEAFTGFGRSTVSELTEFTVRSRPRP